MAFTTDKYVQKMPHLNGYYTGSTRNNKPYGKGNWEAAKQKVGTPAKIQGEWSESTVRGIISYFYTSGAIYCTAFDGTFMTDLSTLIRGKVYFSDGSSYEGGFKNNRFEGFGIYHWVSQGQFDGQYEGEYVDSYQHGKGKYTWPDGLVYDGDWIKGARTGYGTYYYKNVLLYEGDMLNNQYHGHGTRYYDDGSTYEGEWVQGERNGHGIMKFANGSVYDGEWLNDDMLQPEQLVLSPLNGDFLTVSNESTITYSDELAPYFDGLIGMDSVKSQLDKMYKRFKIDGMRAKMLNMSAKKQGYYFIITGHPGTGKTTVARIMAELLHETGLLPSDTFVEVDRGKLVSEYMGQTEKKMNEAIDQARGGTLFIDEAYTLYRKNNSNDPGREAIDILLKDMEDHRGEYCVILAGYQKEMADMIKNANPGLASRFDHHIVIDDYSADELLNIVVTMADHQGFAIEEDAKPIILAKINKEKVDDTFDNARYSRRLLDQAIESQADRLMSQTETLSADDLRILKAVDFGILEEPDTINDVLKTLDQLIGLKNVKEEVHHMINTAKFRIERQKRHLDTKDDIVPLNMVFTGNPGTGKTTVARMIGKIYGQLGLLKRGDIMVEVTRADLVGQYQGQTAPRVREKVREAMGGVLFIDEAYSLVQGPQDSFGLEAVNALITEIENNRDNLAVILAGYTKEMDDFLSSNPGLRSRMNHTIEFPDYTDDEMVEIMLIMLKSRGYQIEADHETIKQFIATFSHQKDFGNGRGVRNLADRVTRHLKERLINSGDLSQLTNDDLTLIKEEDFY